MAKLTGKQEEINQMASSVTKGCDKVIDCCQEGPADAYHKAFKRGSKAKFKPGK